MKKKDFLREIKNLKVGESLTFYLVDSTYRIGRTEVGYYMVADKNTTRRGFATAEEIIRGLLEESWVDFRKFRFYYKN